MTEFKSFFQAKFNTAFSKLEARLDDIQTAILDHQQSLSSLETFANTTSQDMKGHVEAKLAAMSEVNPKIQAKLIDLENRHRRYNVRIVGLPENIEGTQPTDFFSTSS